jgi:Ulp1 family protease
VAIGDGKTELKCLIHCESTFDLSTLQKALGAHTFSKWMKKIQLAEVEKVIVNANFLLFFVLFLLSSLVSKVSFAHI